MPTIKRSSSLAANGTDNPLVGSQYEYLPWPARIEAAILTAPGGLVEATMFSGSDVLLERATVDEKAATEPVQYPYDVTVTDIAAAGERIGISLRETAGAVGPTIVRTVLWITPL